MKTMQELWDDAAFYGKVSVFTMDRGYFAKIKFNCIVGVDLEAKSAYDCNSPVEALEEAISSAKKIVETVCGDFPIIKAFIQ